MKHLILFIATCILVYSIVLTADPLETAVIYKTNVQQIIELTEKYDWIDSELYEIIRFNCQKYGTDINVVCAIIQIESAGNPKAFNKNRNGTHDVGLMQINSVHKVKNVLDININISYGCKYLSECMKKSDSLYQAISFYNTGYNAKWINYGYANKINRWL